MKKLITLTMLLLFAIVGGVEAEETVIFSAYPTTAWNVDASTTDAEITSSNATITGGKMYLTNEQTSAKEMIKKQGGELAFQHTNNNTFFKVVLSQALQAGDVISVRMQSRTDADLGLWFSTADSRPGSDPTSKIVLEKAASQAWVTAPTYTVAEGDGICGETTFYIYRATGKSTYFNTLTITRTAKDERAEATLEFASTTGSADIAKGTSFTLPLLTKTPADAAVTYSSSNTSVATVNETTGAVTLVAKGTTTITASFAGNEQYTAAEANFTLTVTNTNIKTATATFAFNTGQAGQTAVFDVDDVEDVFSLGSVSVADMTYAGVGSDQGVTGTKMQPESKATDNKSQYVKFTVIPRKGITFTPTAISFDALRWGTDGSNKLHYYVECGTASKELGDVNPNRNGKNQGWSHYKHEISGVNATKENPITLACYVYGLATDKQISFANIVITGEYTGVAEEETMYTVTTDVTPEGAGTVTQNPAGTSLTEGTSVTFTAEANTGYRFLNKWMVNEVEQSGATYSIASLAANTEVVAQFKKLKAITFAAGEGTTGVAPETIYADADETITIPVSRFLAKTGFTLTGWTDGVNTYEAGDTYTVTDDATLTAVFAENTESLDFTMANTTVTWDFQKKNIGEFNLLSGCIVTQATINKSNIDVACAFDKNIYNTNWNDWAHIGNKPTLTIPAVSGMKIDMLLYASPKETTIAGSKEYNVTGDRDPYTVSYTYIGTDATIDIVLNDGNYIRTLTVTYPKTHTYIDVTAVGYRTFASSSALDFSESIEGLTAYKATVNGDRVSFEAINTAVPAGEGMLIKANEGRYYIPLAVETPAAIDNRFVGVTEETEITNPIFVLMAPEGGIIGFYKTTKPFTVGKNTAYLPAPVVAEGRTFIGLFEDEGETTGIVSVGRDSSRQNALYNLNGQRIEKAQKGLFIIGGKKVIK